MKQKTFNQLAGIIFTIATILHLSRLIFGWEAIIADWQIPIWVNVVGVVTAGYLAYISFKLQK